MLTCDITESFSCKWRYNWFIYSMKLTAGTSCNLRKKTTFSKNPCDFLSATLQGRRISKSCVTCILIITFLFTRYWFSSNYPAKSAVDSFSPAKPSEATFGCKTPVMAAEAGTSMLCHSSLKLLPAFRYYGEELLWTFWFHFLLEVTSCWRDCVCL